MPPVPFPNADLNAIAATPNRKTWVRFNTPENRILRKHDGGRFTGPDMTPPTGLRVPTMDAAPPANAGQNKNVKLLPSGSWCIASWEMMAQFEREEPAGNLIPPPGVTGITEFAPGFQTFISQSQIPGVSYDPSVVVIGSYWARKRKDASADWHAELSSDVAAIPKPYLITQNAPMRRVAHHLGTLSPNQPVYLRFMGPAAPLATQDALLTFYFGGYTATAYPDGSSTPSGGAFAVTLFGDGNALLWESTTGDPTYPWHALETFTWEQSRYVADRQHIVCFVPEGRDTLSIVGGALAPDHLFRAGPNVTKYLGKASMTGAGSLHLDMREDLRCPFQFGNLTFPVDPSAGTGSGPGSGTIYSVPFQNKFRTGAGTTITIRPDVNAPAGTSVTQKVYDGKTFAALTDAGGGSFATVNAGQRAYYAVFQLHADVGTGTLTPFVRGFEWSIDGVTTLPTPTPFSGGQVLDLTINGCDLEIDCDSASLLIEDDQGLLAQGPLDEGGLEDHAGFRCEIRTSYSPTDPNLTTCLFDGVLVQASGLRTGRNWGQEYPYPKWKTWRIHMAGMWQRLSESYQIAWQSADFTRDRSGAVDADGHPLPWKITDIIIECLKMAGFPDAAIHIVGPMAGADVRLFANGRNPEDYFIQPGKTLGQFIHHLARDYLGGRVIWEEVPKRWIVVYPPPFSGEYLPIWNFVTRAPDPDTADLFPVHMPAAYPDQTTFVENYTTFVTEPEGNQFIVATAFVPGRGYGQADEEEWKNAECHMAIGVNWRSADFETYPPADPTHIDYVPRGVKPVVIVDPALTMPTADATDNAVRFVCRRAMDAGAYGLRWIQWRAPLALYFDPDAAYAGAPRKLRTFDVVTFQEDEIMRNVLITSSNPHISVEEGGDLHQVADYEGYEIPEPLSY